jgi:hypothetical protein
MLKQRSSTPITLSGTNAVSYTGIGGLGSGTANLTDVTYIPQKEVMISTYGKFKSFNLCEHWSWDQVYFDKRYAYKTDPSPSSASSYYNQSNKLLHLPGADESLGTESVLDRWYRESFPGIDPVTNNWRDLSAKALHTMWPKVEKDMDESLANSAVELPSLASTLSLGGRMRTLARASDLSFRRTLKTIIGLRNSTKKERLRAIASTSAGGILASEFAIRPLLSDIMAICRTIREAKRRIERLLENEKRILLSHYSCPIPGVSPGGMDSSRMRSVGNVSLPSSTEWCKYHLGMHVRKAQYTATMRYHYRFTSFQRSHAKLLGTLDALGLRNDPQVLWNMIPFSFIIDYFAHVGNFLGQVTEGGLSPAVYIHGFCHSVNVQYLRDFHIEVSTAPRVTYSKMLAHTMDYRYYYREPHRPSQIEELKLRGLTKYKVFMLGALGAAMKLK